MHVGVGSQCHLHACVIEDAPFAPESFDLITSISVIEHIYDDTNAIRNIWRLLKPGGKLLLSVPCAAISEEEYKNVDFYGVQSPDGRGFFFHQYKYDDSLLEERIFSVTGSPTRSAIFGERNPGTLPEVAIQKVDRSKISVWERALCCSSRI